MSLGGVYAQDSLLFLDSGSLNIQSEFTSESEIWIELKDLGKEKLAEGYLEFSIDSMICENDTCLLFFFEGPIYKFDKISIETEVLSSRMKRQTNRFENKRLNEEGLEALFDVVLSDYEDNGYPFSSVKLNELSFNESRLKASVSVSPNRYVQWDSIVLKTEGRANAKYLSRYLGIIPGKAYDESSFRMVESKLDELSFLKSKKHPEVLFTETGAHLYLYLEEKKANSFNGIIGFLPNDQTGKLNITGDLEIQLINKLNQGERLKLNWKRLESLSQNLDVQFTYPYIFNTDLGIDAGINLFRKDTTFSQVQSNAGLQYNTSATSYIAAFVESDKSTRLSSVSSSLVLADITTLYYGLGLMKENLDYKFNPRQGYSSKVKFAVGTRKVRAELDADEQNKNNTQYKSQIEFSAFFPLLPRTTIMFRTRAFWLSGNDHFENEMFRFGGIKTLRGFDEASFYASSLAIGTFEFRYLLDQNSNVHIFYDQAWYESQVSENYVKDTPYGFGAGVSFQTKAGIFSFSYALGSQQSNPILFKNGKIHFGFTNFF